MEDSGRCIICGSFSVVKENSKSKSHRLLKLWKEECAETVCLILFKNKKQKRTLLSSFKNASYCSICLQNLRELNISWKFQKSLQQKINKYSGITKKLIKANYRNMKKNSFTEEVLLRTEGNNYENIVKMVYQEIRCDRLEFADNGNNDEEKFAKNKDTDEVKLEDKETVDIVDNEDINDDPTFDDDCYSNDDNIHSPAVDEALMTSPRKVPDEVDWNQVLILKVKCKKNGCNYKFLTESEMETHYVQLHDNKCKNILIPEILQRKPRKRKSIKCPKCDKLLRTKSYLSEHMRRFHEERPSCKFCGKLFQTQEEFTIHISNFHQGTNPFECAFCDVKCLNSTDLRVHVIEAHPDPERPKCANCGKTFLTAQGLSLHEKFHNDPSKLKHCQICGKQFLNIQRLKRHIETHNTELSFLCSTCGKAFTNKRNLTRHLRLHNPNKSLFSCTICNKKFKSASSCQNHETGHTSIKPFICGVCGKSFLNKYNMLAHEKIHSGTATKRVRKKKDHVVLMI